MSIKDFELIKKLGEGAYSTVYKVRRIQDSQEYALKKVRMLNLSEKEKENALSEVRILASISNPNIIGYREAFVDEASQSLWYLPFLIPSPSIVMEFADNGDLFQKICDHQKSNTCFSETEIWSIFIQVVRGLKTLHELQIMHRDLKSANVFLLKDTTAKLGDLNVSKVAEKGLNYTQTGTPYYASPEVWRDQPYDVKSDIWSLGCVLYEMITLKPPFRAEDMASLYKKVLKGVYPRIPSSYSQDLAAMVKHLLHVAPHLRPTCGTSVILRLSCLDKILKMPIVATRILKLFPQEDFFSEGQTTLISKIRVPKNIMYLSDKLPKPRYMTTSPEDLRKGNTVTMMGGDRDNSLPAIQQPRKSQQKRPKHAYPPEITGVYRGLIESEPPALPSRPGGT